MSVEELHYEAELKATTACSGAAGIDGVARRRPRRLRFDLELLKPNIEREKGERRRAVGGGKRASSTWSRTTRERRQRGMGGQAAAWRQ